MEAYLVPLIQPWAVKLIMSANIPPEVLYNIIATVCVEYIDDGFERPTKPGFDEYNPVVQLLQVNHQLREVTQKVIEDALGIETDSAGV